MDSDQAIRRLLRDYANDAVARVEHARRLIFDLGRSVGGELDILKRGSLILTRVPISLSPSHIHSYCDPQNAYHTELGVNPATIMPVDILHDCELGVGKGLITHNIRILHTVGEGAVNTFDARYVQSIILTMFHGFICFPTGSAKFPPLAATQSEGLEGVSLP